MTCSLPPSLPAALRVSFDPAVYIVSEGEPVPLSVVLSIPSDNEVTVVLQTSDSTATGT